MKKKLVVLLAVMCLSLLTACGCRHEWLAATCESPKTCELCGETEGDAKGHSWTDAACETPKTCASCGKTEGDALGHDWQDATTEQPKTCALCSLTEGERIVTDPRFTTADTAFLQGNWITNVSLTGEDMNLPEFAGHLDCELTLMLGNDGSMSFGFKLLNEEAFLEDMVAFTIDLTYAQMAAQGIDKETADAIIQDSFQMTMEEYIRSSLSSFDFNAMFESIFSSVSGVYYVENGVLFTGTSWDLPFAQEVYTLENDVLKIDSFAAEMGIVDGFTRSAK